MTRNVRGPRNSLIEHLHSFGVGWAGLVGGTEYVMCDRRLNLRSVGYVRCEGRHATVAVLQLAASRTRVKSLRSASSASVTSARPMPRLAPVIRFVDLSSLVVLSRCVHDTSPRSSCTEQGAMTTPTAVQITKHDRAVLLPFWYVLAVLLLKAAMD